MESPALAAARTKYSIILCVQKTKKKHEDKVRFTPQPMSNLPPFPGGGYGQPASNPYATNYNQPASNANPYATNYNQASPSNTYQTQPVYGGGAYQPAQQYGTPSSAPSSQYGAQAADTTAYAGSSGAFHSYSKEECRGFVNYVNEWVQGDPDLQGLLPINPNSEDVFRVMGTTCLLW